MWQALIFVAGGICIAASFITAILQQPAPLRLRIAELTSAPARPELQPVLKDGRVLVPYSGTAFVTKVTFNGEPVEVLVDTGATFVALTSVDAKKITGLRYTGKKVTSVTFTTHVVSDLVVIPHIRMGPISVRDVPATVSDNATLRSLLGMTFLGHLRWRYDKGVLVLEQ